MISNFQSTTTTFGLAIVLLCSYPVAKAIYNVFFHPLRRYPGPIFAAATNIPALWARLSGRQPFWIANLHEKFGEVVRVAPNELSYISPEAWRDVYGHKIQGRGGIPKDLPSYAPDTAGSNSIIRANDQDHSRQRRLLAHAFSDKALRNQEPLVQKYVDLLIEKLSEIAKTPSADGSTDLVKWYNCTTFDVMADLAFGEPLGLLERSKYTPWISAIFDTVKLSNAVSTFNTYFPPLSSLVTLLAPKSLAKGSELHVENSITRVNKRLSRETDRPDIWTFVLRHKGDDQNMPLHEMHANGGVLIIAGTETTATLLSGLTFHLLRDENKHELDRLVTEVRGAFFSSGDINMTTVPRLPFLQACIQEAFRMYPPVPVGLARKVPPEGRSICGAPVCGETSVYVTQWAAYHSPRNFYAPDSFLPERWLPEAGPQFASDRKDVVEPFSFGPRNCIGKNLAYHEMRLIMAKLLWHFDLQLCQESKDWSKQNVYVLWEKVPLMVKIRPAPTARV